jgi:hypothetical protein
MQTHHEPPDELDVDLGDPDAEQLLDCDTIAEGLDPLGRYATVQAYCRAMLEPEISRGCHWLFDCLDWSAVQRRFEGPHSRLVAESGVVYRMEVEQ